MATDWKEEKKSRLSFCMRFINPFILTLNIVFFLFSSVEFYLSNGSLTKLFSYPLHLNPFFLIHTKFKLCIDLFNAKFRFNFAFTHNSRMNIFLFFLFVVVTKKKISSTLTELFFPSANSIQ